MAEVLRRQEQALAAARAAEKVSLAAGWRASVEGQLMAHASAGFCGITTDADVGNCSAAASKDVIACSNTRATPGPQAVRQSTSPHSSHLSGTLRTLPH